MSGNQKYPWDRLDVGESFFVRANGKNLNTLQGNLASLAWGWCKRHEGLYFTTTIIQGSGVWVTRAKASDRPERVEPDIVFEKA